MNINISCSYGDAASHAIKRSTSQAARNTSQTCCIFFMVRARVVASLGDLSMQFIFNRITFSAYFFFRIISW